MTMYFDEFDTLTIDQINNIGWHCGTDQNPISPIPAPGAAMLGILGLTAVFSLPGRRWI